MNLDFLKNVKLEPVAKTATKTKAVVVKLPETADLRVFANGKAYPSKAFAEKAQLQFMPKVNVAPEGAEPQFDVVGNGLDIFSTLDWGMMDAARKAGALESELLCVAVVPKSAAKVDMWASTKYDENNEPKADVFTQGSSTFSKGRLMELITSTYEINWDEVDYVDFTVVEDSPIGSTTGVYHIPKVVSTGKKKGEATYIRRENLTICPLVISHTELLEPNETPTLDVISEVKADSGSSITTQDAVVTSDPSQDWASQLGQ
jgi:hypothetical protein